MILKFVWFIFKSLFWLSCAANERFYISFWFHWMTPNSLNPPFQLFKICVFWMFVCVSKSQILSLVWNDLLQGKKIGKIQTNELANSFQTKFSMKAFIFYSVQAKFPHFCSNSNRLQSWNFCERLNQIIL